MDLAGRPSLAQHYRLYAQDPARAIAFVGTRFEQLLSDHSCFYVEIRDNVLLAFRPGRELETPDVIELLLAFAELVGGESKQQRKSTCPPDVRRTSPLCSDTIPSR